MKKVIAIILAVAAIVFAGAAVRQYLTEMHAGEEYDAIREEVTEPAPEPEEEINVAPAKPVVEEEHEEEGIDFAKLKLECPDSYAWIRVPGTKIDYPIVQSLEDDSFYLTHSATMEESSAGAIFTEMANATDFSDRHTVIYGHNMNNESMFHTLHNYEDREFFEKNDKILIYLPGKLLQYEVFASYNETDDHLLKAHDLADDEEYRLYLDAIFKTKAMNVNIRTEKEISTDDRIITLSTCNARDDQRYLVQAVLVSEEYK